MLGALGEAFLDGFHAALTVSAALMVVANGKLGALEGVRAAESTLILRRVKQLAL
ncbi:hypothetical protein ACQPZJ_13680 [Actinoplanes sp. CA-054009]